MINYTTIFATNPRSEASTPLNMRPFRSPMMSSSYMTPRTMKLYAFGESASRDLEVANLFLSSQNSSHNRQILDFNPPRQGQIPEFGGQAYR